MKDQSKPTLEGAPKRPTAAAKSYDLLRAHSLFAEMHQDDLRRLSEFATPRSFKGGETLFKKGDSGACLYAIAAGAVKISVPGESGQEAMFNIVSEGEIFGEIALLDGRPRTADAIAVTDCQMFAIGRNEFVSLVNRDPKFAIRLVELLCQRLRRAGEHYEDVLFLDAPARLAKTLLRLPHQSNGPCRRIQITQHHISLMIGLSRESTNKYLRLWETNGWIKIVRGGLILLKVKELHTIAQAGDVYK